LHEDFQASDADHRDPASTSSASITSIVVRGFGRRTIAFIANHSATLARARACGLDVRWLQRVYSGEGLVFWSGTGVEEHWQSIEDPVSLAYFHAGGTSSRVSRHG